MNIIKRSLKIVRAALLSAGVLAFYSVAPAFAVVNNPAPSAKVSFTFDDGLASAITQAAPTLATYGLTGTDYIITGCIGMTTTPNKCAADQNKPYMSWDQVTALKNTYGWNIGGHTVTHPQLATNKLTDAQLTTEIAGGKQALVDHGFNPTDFATPYGDYDPHVLSVVAKSYATHRGFADVDNNVWSYNDLLLNDMQVQAGVTVAQVEARVDEAITNNHWLILTFHNISTNPSTDPNEYEYKTSDLATIAAYVKAKQDAKLIKAVNINDGVVTSDHNLFANGDLAAGLTAGWSTDTPANVTADAANNGSFPESTHAVSMTASPTVSTHLFSPQAAVDSTQTYLFKSYMYLKARTSGELGYYVDEYNAAGSWISGKWIFAKTAVQAADVNFTYQPSSASVKKAALQVYITPNSGISAYVDNFQFFNLADVTPPPAPTNNLLPNSNFDQGVGGGWTTNNTTAFTADSANNGDPVSAAEKTNSIKLLAGSANAFLFAPKVDVLSTNTYNVGAYVNLVTNTNELAFYVDEYDMSGNWISGQYAFAKRNTGAENVSFSYTPTSTNVKQAGLQVILVGGSGITGYLDNVQFLSPTTGTPPPPPPPPPTTGTNLLANGTFDAGLTGGWNTNDPTNITADSSNNGDPISAAEQQNAIKLISSTQNRHLFSPLVTVDPTKSYTLTNWLNITAITSGEVGFYIDEYDASGNWISGQYKTGVKVVSAGDISFTYTPSSATVAKAGLQVIVVGNSGVTAYFDDARWFQN